MKKWVILLILALALFLRLYHFDQLFHWSLDEEYWAYLAFNISQGYHLPLIGGNIGGTGFHTTPWFVYLTSIISLVSNGNPLTLGISAVVVSLSTIFAIFKLGSKLYSVRTGAIAALLYSISSLISFYDRRFWNPMLLPLLTALTIWSVLKIKKGKSVYWLILAVVLSLAFSIHGLAAVLVLIPVIFVVKRKFLNLNLVIGALILMLSFAPLVIFEIKHDFTQTKSLLNSHSFGTQKLDLFNFTIYTFNGLSSVFGYESSSDLKFVYTNNCKNYPQLYGNIFADVILVSVGLYAFLKFRGDWKVRLLVTIIGLNIMILVFWRESLSWYYLLPSTVPLLLLSGRAFDHLAKKSKILVVLIIIILFIFNVSKMASSYHSFGYLSKEITIRKILDNVNNTPFSLTVLNSDSCQNYGYRYLFTYHKKEPTRSYIDGVLGWLYDFRIPRQDVGLNVVIADQYTYINNVTK